MSGEWLLTAGSGAVRSHVAAHHDELWIPAHAFGPSDANVALDVESGRSVVAVSGSVSTTAAGGTSDPTPATWGTYDLRIRWFAAAESNVVQWQAGVAHTAIGEAVDAGDLVAGFGSVVSTTLAAPSNALRETTLVAAVTAPTAGDMVSILLAGLGGEAGDTDNASRYVTEVGLVRVS